MPSADDVIDSRFANALIPDASASPEALAALGQFMGDATVTPFMSRLFPRIMNREMGWFKGRQGGLWVGGRAILSAERLTFVANGMNQALHSGPDKLNWSVSLTDIGGVQVRRGVVTDIIDVQARSGKHSVRCFKARAFAAEIEQARLAQKEDASGPA